MFMLSLKISSPPKRRTELLKALKLMTSPVAVTSGCLMCRVYEDGTVSGDFMIMEEWQTREDLIHHIKTDLFKKILTIAESSTSIPQIRCEKLTNPDGVETIRKLMSSDI